MVSFLEEQARQVYKQFGKQLEEVTIVIPNKRAAVYLQHYLAQLVQRPFFAPEMRTIDEWIQHHTDQRILHATELLLVLYQVHVEREGEEASSFEEFSQKGEIMLSDFNEIDRYLVHPSTIFNNLRDIKAIENWSFDTDDLSEGQKQFQLWWDKLTFYYERLNEKLERDGLTYQGKAYANFLGRIDELPLKPFHYFLGFNALSESEQQIMHRLVKKGRAEVVFDVDAFYVDNPQHEAAYFYRKISPVLSSRSEVPTCMDAVPKHIEVIETGQPVVQAKIAGSVLEKWQQEGKNINTTAVVLADESLLIPLTSSLPASAQQANITMGYPIQFSHLKGCVDVLFDLQFSIKKFASRGIHHQTVVHLIHHPYLQMLIDDGEAITAFQREVRDKNYTFVNKKRLFEAFPRLKAVAAVFEEWVPTATEGIACFKVVVQQLFERLDRQGGRLLDKALLYQFSKGLTQLEQLLHRYPIVLSLQSFQRLFHRFWQSESLSFIGHPTKGLQVMGILETRAIDFEQLIVLGMNEGTLPKSSTPQSFIPRDLRLFHGLPTEQDRQAIFAHHFYRLLHRAKHITLVYHSSNEGWSTGEPSRFITQLSHELDRKKGHQWKHWTYVAGDAQVQTSEVVYHTNAAVREHLKKWFKKGISPSAINKLIECPLDFYYRYVIGLTEEGTVEEQIASATFGTKIHEVLEAVLRDNFARDDRWLPLTVQKFQAEKKRIAERLEKAYFSSSGKPFRQSDLERGQNKLSFDVSKKLIENFLKQQIRQLRTAKETTVPMGLELKEELFYADLQATQIMVDGAPLRVRIKGVADRIDKKGTLYRIIDYKSGGCDKDKVQFKFKEQSTKEMRELLRDRKKGYARQLLLYALIFRQRFPNKRPFAAGIISMLNTGEWIQYVRPSVPKGRSRDQLSDAFELEDHLLDAFEEALLELLSELLEEGYTFRHHPDAKHCLYCGR